MWMTLILRWWREAAIGLLGCALAVSISLGRHWAGQRDEEIAKAKALEQIAKQYDTESKTTAKETSDAFSQLVAQIKDKDIAIANAKKRFTPCPAAGGAGPDGMLHTPSGDGQAHVPESTGGVPQPERLACDRAFIDAAAADAAFVRAVKNWRVKHNLPVE